MLTEEEKKQKLMKGVPAEQTRHIEQKIKFQEFIDDIQKRKTVKNHTQLPTDIRNYIFKCVINKKDGAKKVIRSVKQSIQIEEDSLDFSSPINISTNLAEDDMKINDTLNTEGDETLLETVNEHAMTVETSQSRMSLPFKLEPLNTTRSSLSFGKVISALRTLKA
jgi:hypothetical protein